MPDVDRTAVLRRRGYPQRTQKVLPSCYNCRTEFDCTAVCPKEISPTRAIKYIQRQALIRNLSPKRGRLPARESVPAAATLPRTIVQDSRRKFLRHMTCALGAATAAVVGGVALTATVAPALRKPEKQWILACRMNALDLGKVSSIQLRYGIRNGFYDSRNT